MALLTTRRLIIVATLINGILASGNINRAFVDMPAWRHLGALGWAAFSRQADLGGNVMILYPLEAFSGAVLSIAGAVSFRRDRSEPRSAWVPIYTAALLTIGGLLITTQAAPFMLSVRHLGEDTTALQRAFDGFEFWGGVRDVFQILAYLASFWAVIVVSRHVPAPSHHRVSRKTQNATTDS
jgi:hypothetical protein